MGPFGLVYLCRSWVAAWPLEERSGMSSNVGWWRRRDKMRGAGNGMVVYSYSGGEQHGLFFSASCQNNWMLADSL